MLKWSAEVRLRPIGGLLPLNRLRLLSGLITCLMVSSVVSSAHAGRNDFVLHRFRSCTPDLAPDRCINDGQARFYQRDGIIWEEGYVDNGYNTVNRILPDTESFGNFAQELGLAFAPHYLASAETLGQAGFAFGMGTTFTDIKEKSDYWVRAKPDPDPNVDPLRPVLTTLNLHLRKGLPFSFEVGGTLTHLVESNMFALGAELKWAFNEGFDFLPDVAVRGSVNRMVGNRDLDLTVGGGDISISHPFAVAGMATITPYAGWNLLFIYASSHVLDGTPGLDAVPPSYCQSSGEQRGEDDRGISTDECARAVQSQQTNDLRANFVLAQQRKTLNRFFGGMRLRFTVVSLVAEFAYGGGLSSYSAKLELDF